jgi:membrane protease YdiL (CAAX protease family)
LGCGAGAGALLGLCAVGYRQVVLQLPAIQELIARHPEMAMTSTAHFWWLALLAIGFAPIAEEYLFRGLLYRALDREWGGWRALVGGAAFFAIYHPPLSWLPVGLLGLLNAFIFKKAGRLLPCVFSHMAYNAALVLIR